MKMTRQLPTFGRTSYKLLVVGQLKRSVGFISFIRGHKSGVMLLARYYKVG